MTEPLILVVEDGDEYLDVLTRFVDGYRYHQVHDGHHALAALKSEPIDAVYLDMRFDRIPRDRLLGDHQAQVEKFGGDTERAWSFLEKNQGLFILNHLCRSGFEDTPMVLSYDFSTQTTRWQHLAGTYANLSWLVDTVTPDDIRTHFNSVLE